MRLLSTLLLLFCFHPLHGKGFGKNCPAGLKAKLDSLLASDSPHPFNSVVLISVDGKSVYAKAKGYANLSSNKQLSVGDEFLIGSISKQITAVIVLREFEAGHLSLDTPIYHYLPALTQKWSDSVTIRHLLSHTHGIREDVLDSALAFKPGTGFAYSKIGYQLLSDIAEKVSGKRFRVLVTELFQRCGMKHTYYPSPQTNGNVVCGYEIDSIGKIQVIPWPKALDGIPVAAGGFISTVYDIARWNTNLYGGQLLASSTYQQMISPAPAAVRAHPIFGRTQYGYGITIDTTNGILQVGQTGMVPGFNAMSFCFPEHKLSVIVLSNAQQTDKGIIASFHYHTAVLNLVGQTLIRND